MPHPRAAPIWGAPPPQLIADDVNALLWIASALALAGFFATLRHALRHSLAARVLARAASERQRTRLEPLLERASSLATSAGLLELAFNLVFATTLLGTLASEPEPWGATVAKTVVIAVPVLLLVTEVFPSVVARRWGDALLVHVLPPFRLLQTPLQMIVKAFELAQNAMVRVLGLPETHGDARQIVEGLREVIEDSEISGQLDETEREIIGNVMEFRDVDVAAVMTPRTEIAGVEVGESLVEVARRTSESGHSRMPVYEGSLDTIIGTISARDLVRVVGEHGLRSEGVVGLREIVRPAYFVPETKPVSELLGEFRREKIKIAVVLDEYGGTAGLVTLGDVIAEIVGDIQDEFDRDEPQAIHRLDDGAVEVDAALHVSEVNEELDLDLPDGEDYETLGGFVLAELGRFPKEGETFGRGGAEFTVVEASDRRVLKVRVRPATAKRIGA